MTLNMTHFLVSLAAALATEAGLTLGTDVLTGQMVEPPPPNEGPYAVIRKYQGPPPMEMRRRPRTISVQVMASGKKETLVEALLQRLFEAAYNEDEQPRNDWVIPGKKAGATAGSVEADPAVPNGYVICLLSPLQEPGAIGRDSATGTWQHVFNMDVTFDLV